MESLRIAHPEARPESCGSEVGSPRRRAHRSLSGLFVFACFIAACTLEEPQDRVFFDLEADPSLMAYSRVTITLQDSLGRPLATLFNDSLKSLDQLDRLPAGPYAGGSARIVIQGFGSDGRPLYRETRLYEGETQRVVAIEVFLGPFAPGGLDTSVPAPVPVPPRPPVLAAVMRDTLVSIRDSVTLWAQATDADGDLAGWGLDCDGDGNFEVSSAISGFRADIFRGRRFMDSGSHVCRIRVWDQGSRETLGRLAVRVELDLPVADAGKDTAVTVGTQILLHARGTDRFGTIVKWEWKIGSKPFVPGLQGVSIHQAPFEPTQILCILRITDSDGLLAMDTLAVNVIPRTSPP